MGSCDMNVKMKRCSNEKLETGQLGYMAEFVYNGVYYYLSGVMERNDFDEMLKKIHF